MATAPATVYGNYSRHKSHGAVLQQRFIGKKGGAGTGEGQRQEGRFLFTHTQHSDI